MNRIDHIILVENNHSRAVSALKMLEEAQIAESIKVAVNGEHALLCLDHLDLYMRIRGKKILVILNIDTPITNGIEFLDGYKKRKYPNKEDIMVVVSNNTSPENIEKALGMGASDVINDPLSANDLSELINKFFWERQPKEMVVRKRMVENRRISA